jgi:hypothetical protein
MKLNLYKMSLKFISLKTDEKFHFLLELWYMKKTIRATIVFHLHKSFIELDLCYITEFLSCKLSRFEFVFYHVTEICLSTPQNYQDFSIIIPYKLHHQRFFHEVELAIQHFFYIILMLIYRFINKFLFTPALFFSSNYPQKFLHMHAFLVYTNQTFLGVQ